MSSVFLRTILFVSYRKKLVKALAKAERMTDFRLMSCNTVPLKHLILALFSLHCYVKHSLLIARSHEHFVAASP